jgi:hypothetical protein
MKRRRRSKTPGVPPPPVVKLKSPSYGDLKIIYRKLVTANQSTRVAALFEAFDWWDAAIKYFMHKTKITPEQIKKFGVANKMRNLAIGGSNDNEKESAALQTLVLLEKIWAKEMVPGVKHYYKKYEENKDHLELKEAAATARFQTVLEALNESFKSLNLTFELVKKTNSGNIREYDGVNKILLSFTLAKVLNEKIKHEGLLPVLFSEAFTVIKSSGIEAITDPDAPGQIKHVPNLQMMLKSVPVVLEGILQYISNANPKKIFRAYSGTLEATANATIPAAQPGVKIPKTKITHTHTKTHKHHTPRGGGNLVGGRYQAGSAMALLYQRLADQKVHALGDLFQGLAVNNPRDRLKYLIKHGTRSGNWSIVLQGNTAKMVLP